MKLLIEIDMDNEAFKDDLMSELDRITQAIPNHALGMLPGESCNLLDSNGNTCGTVKLVSEKPKPCNICGRDIDLPLEDHPS